MMAYVRSIGEEITRIKGSAWHLLRGGEQRTDGTDAVSCYCYQHTLAATIGLPYRDSNTRSTVRQMVDVWMILCAVITSVVRAFVPVEAKLFLSEAAP